MKDLALSLPRPLPLLLSFFFSLSTFYILHVKSIKSTMLTRWEMNGATNNNNNIVHVAKALHTQKKHRAHINHPEWEWENDRTKESMCTKAQEQWQNVNVKKAHEHTHAYILQIHVLHGTGEI